MTLPLSGQLSLQDIFREFHSSSDPLWAAVGSAISFNGTPGTTTFVDSVGFTWTPTGNPILSDTQKLYGSTSLYLDGSSYLSIPQGTSPNLAWGTAEFTIEFWVYPTSPSGRQVILALGNNTRINCDGTTLTFERSGVDEIEFVNGLNLNQWNYVVLWRLTHNQVICMTSNGYGPSASGFTVNFNTDLLRIGAKQDGSSLFTGYLYDLRLTGFFSRYAAPSIPVSPLGYNNPSPPLEQTNLSDYYRGDGIVPDSPSNASIPTSGAISIADFYGAEESTTTIQPVLCNGQFLSGPTSFTINIADQVDAIDQTVLLVVLGIGSTTLSYDPPEGWTPIVLTRNGRAGLFIYSKWFDKNVDPTSYTFTRTFGAGSPTISWLLSIPYSYENGFEVVIPSVTAGNVDSIAFPDVSSTRNGDMPLYFTTRCAAQSINFGTPTITASGQIDGIDRAMGYFTWTTNSTPGCSLGVSSFPGQLVGEGSVFENVVVEQANDATGSQREWQGCCILFHHRDYQ